MSTIRVGTSGYSYADWVGPVYPPGTRPVDYLSLYAQWFSFTELNFTYYRLPKAGQLAAMTDRVPSNFRFAVKAHGSMTHDRNAPDAAYEEFRHGLEEMGGKLGALLLQFPYSFHYEPENRRYLDTITRRFEGLPLAVELRHGEWQNDNVREACRERGLALVATDTPDLPGLQHNRGESTAGFSYLRFHGRNGRNWWDGTNTSRYDYRYSDQELREWTGDIVAMAETGDVLYVAFNNHFVGQAVDNARWLKSLLTERNGLEIL